VVPVSLRRPRWPAALLCDKDGTLVVDIAYNGDPELVAPLPGVGDALERVRAAGLAVGIVSNQSGVARGLLSERQLGAVLRRTEELLGPFDIVLTCRHAEEAGCPCRKPAPGMVVAAAASLQLPPSAIVVVGDTGADVEAARRAGAQSVLVPNDRTLPGEVDAAPIAATSFAAAVEVVLGWFGRGELATRQAATEGAASSAGSRPRTSSSRRSSFESKLEPRADADFHASARRPST
jgi:histidinol-phosphate phosphatase family protein